MFCEPSLLLLGRIGIAFVLIDEMAIIFIPSSVRYAALFIHCILLRCNLRVGASAWLVELA